MNDAVGTSEAVDVGGDEAQNQPVDVAQRLAEIPGTRVFNRPLSEMTTLRIGGQPRLVVRCDDAESIAAVVRFLDEEGVATLILGGGSNIVAGDSAAVGDLVVVWLAVSDDPVESDPAAAPTNPADTQSPGTVPSQSGAEFVSIDSATGVVRCAAGVEWDDFVARTVAAGLGGLECLSGIPGSAGATPVQNVGAYGVEVSQYLTRVRLYDRATRTLEWVAPEALELGYRYSNVKFTGRAVVTDVEFQLHTDGLSAPLRYGELRRRLEAEQPDAVDPTGVSRLPAAAVREAVLALRRGKGMVLDAADHDTWSAGSFFTNPVVASESLVNTIRESVRASRGDADADGMPVYPAPGGFKLSAAWLIERAGFPKGWHVPGREAASISTKHTLALTNRGDATSADIVELAVAVRDGVWRAFGVELEPEPLWVGQEFPQLRCAEDDEGSRD